MTLKFSAERNRRWCGRVTLRSRGKPARRIGPVIGLSVPRDKCASKGREANLPLPYAPFVKSAPIFVLSNRMVQKKPLSGPAITRIAGRNSLSVPIFALTFCHASARKPFHVRKLPIRRWLPEPLSFTAGIDRQACKPFSLPDHTETYGGCGKLARGNWPADCAVFDVMQVLIAEVEFAKHQLSVN